MANTINSKTQFVSLKNLGTYWNFWWVFLIIFSISQIRVVYYRWLSWRTIGGMITGSSTDYKQAKCVSSKIYTVDHSSLEQSRWPFYGSGRASGLYRVARSNAVPWNYPKQRRDSFTIIERSYCSRIYDKSPESVLRFLNGTIVQGLEMALMMRED